MRRVEPFEKDAMTPEQLRIAERISEAFGGVHGPYAAWIRLPGLCRSIFDQLDYLRVQSPLRADLRLLATIVAVRHWGARYAWAVNAPLAVKNGVAKGIVDAINEGRAPEFDDAEQRTVYAVCTEILETRGLSDTSFSDAVARLGRDRFTDVVATLGHFSMVSHTLLAFDVPPRGDAPEPLAARD